MAQRSGRQADGSIVTRFGNGYTASEWDDMQAQFQAEEQAAVSDEQRVEHIEDEAIARCVAAGAPEATARKLVYSITRPDPFRAAAPIQFSSAAARHTFQPIIDWLTEQA